jgi:ribonuclease P protein component
VTRAATVSRPEPTARSTATAPAAPVRRLSGTARFDALRRTGHRVRVGPLRVSWVPDGAVGSALDRCVAYAIGRRVGPAVVRNRLRRRLRAVVAELAPGAPAGDYLIACDPEAASLPFSDLKALVSKAFTALSPTAAAPAR